MSAWQVYKFGGSSLGDRAAAPAWCSAAWRRPGARSRWW